MSKITKDTTIGELIKNYPKSRQILLKYGLHCIGCRVAFDETIEQGALAHGIVGDEFDQMIKELEKLT